MSDWRYELRKAWKYLEDFLTDLGMGQQDSGQLVEASVTREEQASLKTTLEVRSDGVNLPVRDLADSPCVENLSCSHQSHKERSEQDKPAIKVKYVVKKSPTRQSAFEESGPDGDFIVSGIDTSIKTQKHTDADNKNVNTVNEVVQPDSHKIGSPVRPQLVHQERLSNENLSQNVIDIEGSFENESVNTLEAYLQQTKLEIANIEEGIKTYFKKEKSKAGSLGDLRMREQFVGKSSSDQSADEAYRRNKSNADEFDIASSPQEMVIKQEEDEKSLEKKIQFLYRSKFKNQFRHQNDNLINQQQTPESAHWSMLLFMLSAVWNENQELKKKFMDSNRKQDTDTKNEMQRTYIPMDFLIEEEEIEANTRVEGIDRRIRKQNPVNSDSKEVKATQPTNMS
ncbi:hypothetical protein ACHWQZ_G016641 [Mnemiopsis leidyi]